MSAQNSRITPIDMGPILMSAEIFRLAAELALTAGPLMGMSKSGPMPGL